MQLKLTYTFYKQKVQLSLRRTDRTRVLESWQIIFMSSERAHATSYWCLIETLILSLKIAENINTNTRTVGLHESSGDSLIIMTRWSGCLCRMRLTTVPTTGRLMGTAVTADTAVSRADLLTVGEAEALASFWASTSSKSCRVIASYTRPHTTPLTSLALWQRSGARLPKFWAVEKL